MHTGTKPAGYPSVSVYIVAQGAQKVIDFLKSTFDAAQLRRFDKSDGSIMHAEMRIGDSVVMIADASGSYPPLPVWLHVYVDDVDKTYQRALAAGGVSVEEPVHKGHDTDKRGGVQDPCGNTWWIATQVA